MPSAKPEMLRANSQSSPRRCSPQKGLDVRGWSVNHENDGADSAQTGNIWDDWHFGPLDWWEVTWATQGPQTCYTAEDHFFLERTKCLGKECLAEWPFKGCSQRPYDFPCISGPQQSRLRVPVTGNSRGIWVFAGHQGIPAWAPRVRAQGSRSGLSPQVKEPRVPGEKTVGKVDMRPHSGLDSKQFSVGGKNDYQRHLRSNLLLQRNFKKKVPNCFSARALQHPGSQRSSTAVFLSAPLFPELLRFPRPSIWTLNQRDHAVS